MFKVFVKYWEGENREIKKCGGLLCVSSYIKAMEKVICHSGSSGENIISVYISELENPIEWKEIKNWFIEKESELK